MPDGGSALLSAPGLGGLGGRAGARAFSSASVGWQRRLGGGAAASVSGEAFWAGERQRRHSEQRRTLFGWGRGKGGAAEGGAAAAGVEDGEATATAAGMDDGGTKFTVDDGLSSRGGADDGFAESSSRAVGSEGNLLPPAVEASSALPTTVSSSSFDSVPSFGSSPIQPEGDILTAAAEAIVKSGAGGGGLPWEPLWYNPVDHAVNCINYVQQLTDVPYAVTIAGLTCVIRVAVFPLFVKAQQNTSRMAHMKPEMDQLKARIDAMGSSVDQAVQMQHMQATRALFKKYDCNPLKALMVPLVQAPVFMSMFFGLRKMPDYFPDELSNGGILWFTDLTASDPTGAMPVISAALFLAMMEVGKKQMLASGENGSTMLWFFRGIGVVMVPITWNFSAAIFCYWCTNNVLSVAQGALFRSKEAKRALGIWEPPPPVPGAPPVKGAFQQLQEALGNKKDKVKELEEKIKAHNASIDRQKDAKVRRKGRGNKNSSK